LYSFSYILFLRGFFLSLPKVIFNKFADSGKLSINGLDNLLQHLSNIKFNPEELQHAFDLLDKDHKHYISFSDFKLYFNADKLESFRIQV